MRSCCLSILYGPEMRPNPNHTKLIALITVFFVLTAGCSSFRHKRDVDPHLRQEIVDIALKYRGTPYLYGGNSPDGFDCTGYVQFVFRQAGVDIPRTSSRQFQAGRKIARDNLKKGDLVFFTKFGLINILLPPNHVGIYIGRNRFIHAPSSGKTVRTDHLDSPYWRKHYKGAGNLL